jgi:hypothetical protein
MQYLEVSRQGKPYKLLIFNMEWVPALCVWMKSSNREAGKSLLSSIR